MTIRSVAPRHRPLFATSRSQAADTLMPLGNPLRILFRSSSQANAVAAERVFHRLITELRSVPPVVATDKLRSYGVVHRELCLDHPPPAPVAFKFGSSHQPAISDTCRASTPPVTTGSWMRRPVLAGLLLTQQRRLRSSRREHADLKSIQTECQHLTFQIVQRRLRKRSHCPNLNYWQCLPRPVRDCVAREILPAHVARTMTWPRLPTGSSAVRA
jgi:hypothetical protein